MADPKIAIPPVVPPVVPPAGAAAGPAAGAPAPLPGLYDEIVASLSDRWHYLALALTAVVLGYMALAMVLGRLFKRLREKQGTADPAREKWLRELEVWFRIALLLVAVCGGVVASLAALGIAQDKIVIPVGEKLATKGPKVLLILFLAFLARRTLKFLTAQFVIFLEQKGDQGRGAEVRFKTLADVLSGAGLVLIAVISGFMILETLLESVGTVLASVGFLGIALGFGAQTLVKDVISGFFIILENQIAIGDAVRINDVWGSVERMGLRSTTLRDSEGIAHMIPNGSIARISNATKGWSRAVVYVATDYAADPEKVLEVLRGLAKELAANPQYKAIILGEPEVKGPESFEDGAVYRVAVRTYPTQQWDVMRVLRQQILKAFQEAGIRVVKSPLNSGAGRVE